MGRFYCDYCQLYLTPDAASVRKNHLTGRNHVKLLCDHYESVAKEQGAFPETNTQPTLHLFKGIPGSTGTISSKTDYYKITNDKALPPPPTLQGLPAPPAKLVCDPQISVGILKTAK